MDYTVTEPACIWYEPNQTERTEKAPMHEEPGDNTAFCRARINTHIAVHTGFRSLQSYRHRKVVADGEVKV